MVGMARLELARLAPPHFECGVSTSSTTSPDRAAIVAARRGGSSGALAEQLCVLPRRRYAPAAMQATHPGRNAALIAILGSVIALGTAFASQYLGGLVPCE